MIVGALCPARTALADRPCLLGNEPHLCEFFVNAELVYLSRPPASVSILREFPKLEVHVERMNLLHAVNA